MRTPIEIARTEADFALLRLEILKRNGMPCSKVAERGMERVEGIAANLRGTLKNPAATAEQIKSLSDDLAWLLRKAEAEQDRYLGRKLKA
jgi:hypothetical protein